MHTHPHTHTHTHTYLHLYLPSHPHTHHQVVVFVATTASVDFLTSLLGSCEWPQGSSKPGKRKREEAWMMDSSSAPVVSTHTHTRIHIRIHIRIHSHVRSHTCTQTRS